MKKMYVTYVLYSKKFDKLHIGQTGSLIARFKSYNELAKKGLPKDFDHGW
jgi:hypothetical protein